MGQKDKRILSVATIGAIGFVATVTAMFVGAVKFGITQPSPLVMGSFYLSCLVFGGAFVAAIKNAIPTRGR